MMNVERSRVSSFLSVCVMNEDDFLREALDSRNRDCSFCDMERIHQAERETKRHFCVQERGNNPEMDTEESGMSSR
jgi:hypothetical protein